MDWREIARLTARRRNQQDCGVNEVKGKKKWALYELRDHQHQTHAQLDQKHRHTSSSLAHLRLGPDTRFNMTRAPQSHLATTCTLLLPSIDLLLHRLRHARGGGPQGGVFTNAELLGSLDNIISSTTARRTSSRSRSSSQINAVKGNAENKEKAVKGNAADAEDKEVGADGTG
ncbi:hypothetical protein V8E36_000880 [Tilletia maclaganii]